MVDRLRGALDGLEPPACPKCRIEMRWFRSELVSESSSSIQIAHHFQCEKCGSLKSSEARITKSQGSRGPAGLESLEYRHHRLRSVEMRCRAAAFNALDGSS